MYPHTPHCSVPELRKSCVLILVLLVLSTLSLQAQTATSTLDTMILGDSASETAHSLTSNSTEVVTGGMGLLARHTQPLSPAQVNGGNLTFTMAVDPVKRNYFTLKLWADDNTSINIGRIYLYIPDSQFHAGSTKMYQVGYRHEGDYMAAMANSTAKSPLPGRFYYSTILLPLAMTSGRSSLQLRIQTTGRLYTLGSGGPPSGNYQFVQNLPSVTMYRAYTHTQPYLDVHTETQGSAPATTIQVTPTDSILAPGGTFYNGVVNFINGRLSASASSLGTQNVEVMARAYSSQALPFYQSQSIVTQVVAALDYFASAYYNNPTGSVSAGGNEGWGGRFGYLGWAIHLLLSPLTPYLDQTASYGVGGTLTRRVAWSQMLFASREYGRFNRDGRLISNQSLLANASIYQANRGLADLGDSRAFSETDAQRYLLEAGGIQPFLGSDLAGGGSSYILGNTYLQVSPKGQTREWGFVASNYGEMQGHLADFYQMTGNTAFRDQAVKMVKGKAYFRRPAIEAVSGQFYQSMEDIGLLAWRGANESDSNGFATEQVYGDRTGNNWGLHCAAVTQDPTVVGYAKQLLADNQLFTQLLYNADYNDVSAIDIFDEYPLVSNMSDSGIRLPMTPGQPDTAYADEVTGVVAIHHGNEYLWAAPFYQAKTGTGINSLARFHYSTPTYDQFGMMETNAVAPLRSTVFVRPDLIDKPEGNYYVPPDNPSNAYAGENMMIAPTPSGASYDGPFRGRADFWAFRFGHYLVGMNGSTQTYNLNLPSDVGTTSDLISGNPVSSPSIAVAAQNTVAVYVPASATSDGTLDPCPVAGSPNVISYTATSQNVTLTWTRASGATSYQILRRLTNQSSYTQVASGVTSLQYSDAIALSPSNPPYYQVIGENNCGTGYSLYTLGPVYSTALPANVSSLDIGTVSTPGSATYTNGVYAVSGSGSDIGGTNDNFQFTYFSSNKDGDYIVRLLNADATKAGLMIRNTLDKSSSMAIVMLNSALARYAGRATTGATAVYTNGVSVSTPPIWLRLNKNGTTITSYSSFDGTTWSQIQSSQITAGTTFYVGLAVTSRSSSAQTAYFDNLSTPTP